MDLLLVQFYTSLGSVQFYTASSSSLEWAAEQSPYTGAYPGGRPPGGPSKSLILAPLSKSESPYPPPPRQFGAPVFVFVFVLFCFVLFFLSLEPLLACT